MSWKEIMMAINSDIRTPLNKLIERVLDKLDNISTGGETGSSGSKPFYTSGLEKNINININPNVSTLPYNFIDGSAVIYNNEIHILGGSSSTAHYKIIIEYLCYICLPSRSAIHFYDSRISSIIEKTNCTKQLDGSLLVNSDGLVEFEVTNGDYSDNRDIKYSIF